MCEKELKSGEALICMSLKEYHELQTELQECW